MAGDGARAHACSRGGCRRRSTWRSSRSAPSRASAGTRSATGTSRPWYELEGELEGKGGGRRASSKARVRADGRRAMGDSKEGLERSSRSTRPPLAFVRLRSSSSTRPPLAFVRLRSSRSTRPPLALGPLTSIRPTPEPGTAGGVGQAGCRCGRPVRRADADVVLLGGVLSQVARLPSGPAARAGLHARPAVRRPVVLQASVSNSDLTERTNPAACVP